MPCSLSHSASLAASVVLPAPWRPASMMTVGAGLGVAQPAGLAAEDRDQLVVDDLDDLLGGVQRAADLLAAGPLLDRGDELLDHGQRDVRLEQRDADLARGGVDVGVGEPALAAEVLEGVGEPVGECGEQVEVLRVVSGGSGASLAGGSPVRRPGRTRGPAADAAPTRCRGAADGRRPRHPGVTRPPPWWVCGQLTASSASTTPSPK